MTLGESADMGHAAAECIEDAIEATKAFLLPVDRDRWLPMAVIVFFLSAGASVGSAPNLAGQFAFGGAVGDADLPQGGPPWEWSLAQVPDSVWLLLGGLVLALLVLLLVFGIVGAVMEFVLVEALRTEAARVRTPFRRYFRAGLSLFAFQVALFLAFIAIPLGALGLFVVLPALSGGAPAGALVGMVILFVLLFLLLVFVAAIVHGFTVAFVVPVMVVEECGVIAGWRRFWPTLRGNLGEFAVYVVLRWVLAIAVSFIGGTVTGLLGAFVAVPVLLLAGGLFLGTGGALTPVTIATYVLVLVGFLLLVTALGALVQVPLKTFTRYYELLVLGDIESEFDLVPEQREAVRAPDFEAEPGEDGASS